jgi:hypothetical protein
MPILLDSLVAGYGLRSTPRAPYPHQATFPGPVTPGPIPLAASLLVVPSYGKVLIFPSTGLTPCHGAATPRHGSCRFPVEDREVLPIAPAHPLRNPLAWDLLVLVSFPAQSAASPAPRLTAFRRRHGREAPSCQSSGSRAERRLQGRAKDPGSLTGHNNPSPVRKREP